MFILEKKSCNRYAYFIVDILKIWVINLQIDLLVHLIDFYPKIHNVICKYTKVYLTIHLVTPISLDSSN